MNFETRAILTYSSFLFKLFCRASLGEIYAELRGEVGRLGFGDRDAARNLMARFSSAVVDELGLAPFTKTEGIVLLK